MAHGDIITMTWTGNPTTPVPATLTVADTYGAAVIEQTLVLEQFRNDVAALGDLLIELKKTVATMNYLVSTYNKAILSISAQSGQRNAIAAMQVASTIQTNNFYTAVQGENPTMPSTVQQLETTAKDGTTLHGVSQAEGAIILQTNVMNQYFQSFVTDALEPFTSVLSNYSDRLKTAILGNPPSNAQDIATKAATQAGVLDSGNTK